MIQCLLGLSLLLLLPLQVVAEAPVVDDSENFALFDKEQAAIERPVDKTQSDATSNSEETAFAHDNTHEENINSTSLVNKLQGMQQDIQELRGQLEMQSHELKALKEQQLDFYKDLDTRLGENSTHPTNPKTIAANDDKLQAGLSKAVINSPRANPAEEQISYLAAYDLVKSKRFEEALVALQTFVNHYPQGGYTANAQYWLGETYLVKKDYSKAIDHFETVLKQFPSSSKAAASTLKAGYALIDAGRKNEAIQLLQQVLKNYPDTPIAQLATAKLESLGSL